MQASSLQFSSYICLIVRRITSVYHTTLQLPLSNYLLFANYSLSLNFFVLGARAVDMNVCPKEMIELYCPPLEQAIRSGDYRELIWKVYID